MQGVVGADSARIAAWIRRLDRGLLGWDDPRGLRRMVERGKWSSLHFPELEAKCKTEPRRRPRSSCGVEKEIQSLRCLIIDVCCTQIRI